LTGEDLTWLIAMAQAALGALSRVKVSDSTPGQVSLNSMSIFPPPIDMKKNGGILKSKTAGHHTFSRIGKETKAWFTKPCFGVRNWLTLLCGHRAMQPIYLA
jgi:hypothetical protein